MQSFLYKIISSCFFSFFITTVSAFPKFEETYDQALFIPTGSGYAYTAVKIWNTVPGIPNTSLYCYFYDKNDQLLKKHEFILKGSVYLQDYGASANELIITMWVKEFHKYSSYYFKANGELIIKNEETIAKSFLVPKILASSSDGVYFLKDSFKKSPLTIIKKDFQGQILWERVFSEYTVPIRLRKAELVREQSLILDINVKIDNADKSQIISINAKTGKDEYFKVISTPNRTRIPTRIQEVGEELYVSGIYFDSRKVNDNSCTGFYLMILDKEGKEKSYKEWDWKEDVIKLLERSLMKPATNKIQVQEVTKTPQGYQLIIENFDKVANGVDLVASLGASAILAPIGYGMSVNVPYSTYKMYELIVFTTDESGKILSFSFVNKEKSYKAIRMDLGELQTVALMQSNHLFDYLFEENNKQTGEKLYFFEQKGKKMYKVGYFTVSQDNKLVVKFYDLSKHLSDFDEVKDFKFTQISAGQYSLIVYEKKKVYVKYLKLDDFE
jgi:hypothetical protein